MTNPGNTYDEIIQEFEKLRWHDAKLLNLSLYRNSSNGNETKITVSFELESGWSPLISIIFIDSTYLKMAVDLEGKRVCSDSIESASCYKASEWITALTQTNPYDNFSGYLHFNINLIHPGGSIDILAKGFLISEG